MVEESIERSLVFPRPNLGGVVLTVLSFDDGIEFGFDFGFEPA